MTAAEQQPAWLGLLTTPSILVLSAPDTHARLALACEQLDPECFSLASLLDKRGGSKQVINYLTPSLRLSNLMRFHFTSAAPLLSPVSSSSSSSTTTNNNLDAELQNAVSEFPPNTSATAPSLSASRAPYPWFLAFKRALLKATLHLQGGTGGQGDFAELTGSTFHLPACMVLALEVGADEDSLVQHARQLAQHNSTVLPQVPRILLLVSSTPVDDAADVVEAAARRLRQEFVVGGSTSSSTTTTAVAVLSLADESALETSFHQLSECIVKLMSNRAFALNEHVAQHKKGLTNTFRSFFSSAQSSLSAAASNSSSASANGSSSASSLTNKTRTLGDVLFALRDYDGALHAYTYLKDDFSKDAGDLMRLGSALEMMARCLVLLPSSSSQHHHLEKRLELLERAIDSYLKAAATVAPAAAASSSSAKRPIPLAYRLASNAVVLLLETTTPTTTAPLPPPGVVRLTLKLLRRVMSVESEVSCAVLLEQGALLTQQRLGMRRKACFDVLRAGSLFRTLGLNAHAFRCYQQLYKEEIKRGSGWFAAEHHLQLNLGYLARNLRDNRQLVDLRGALLERGMQIEANPASHHALLLKEYCDAMDSSTPPVKHRLPRLERVAATAGPSVVLMAYAQERTVVSVRATNPLFCPLPVADMQVFADDDEEGVVRFTCEAVHVTLPGKDTQVVELAFTPHQPGDFTLRGVRWRVLGEGVFQHTFVPPLVVRVAPTQACLRATLLPFAPSNRFQLELKNVGSVELPAGQLLVSSSDPSALQLGNSAAVVVEVVNATTAGVPHGALPPGDTLTLQCRQFSAASVTSCVVQYGGGDGGGKLRSLEVDLPPLSAATATFVPPTVKATVVFALSQPGDHASPRRLLVVDVSSHFPLRPTGVACLHTPASISNIGNRLGISPITSEEDALALAGGEEATTWQLVFELSERGANVVPLSSSAQCEPLLPDTDFRLRYHHLLAVNRERDAAKLRLDELRREMEAKGQLPVSIQDVRRARQNNSALFAAAEAAGTTGGHHAGSAEAILGDNGQFVHLALDWTASADSSTPGRSYCCRVPVPQPQGLALSFVELGLQHELELSPQQETCQLAVTVRVHNQSARAVSNVWLEIGGGGGGGEGGVRGAFPRPEFWLGSTRRSWKQLAPGECVEVAVSAVFTGAGVYLLGPVQAKFDEDEDSTSVVALEGERFVVVTRRLDAMAMMTAKEDDRDVFLRVQQALNDDVNADDFSMA